MWVSSNAVQRDLLPTRGQEGTHENEIFEESFMLEWI